MSYNKFWTNFNEEHYKQVLIQRGVLAPQRSRKHTTQELKEKIDLLICFILLISTLTFIYRALLVFQ